MWQKQLKQLKKQTVTAKAPTKRQKSQETAEPQTSQDISFREYCEEFQIEPLIQDSVILKPQPQQQPARQQPQHKLSSGQYESEFMFFDQDEAKQEYYRYGQKNMPRELRNGKYPLKATLDLHNFTSNHALGLLEHFIETAASGGSLRIIHGIGLNSANNQPVLRGLVRRFLEFHPEVIAYSYGSPHQGGHGVTMVKLRG